MTPLLLSIVSPVVGVAVASLVGYLVYVNKTRITASVELVVDTKSVPPSVDVAVTNRGKSPIVVTALRVHVPAECIGVPGGLGDRLKDVPIWRRNHLLGLRRRLKTSGSRNDAIAKGIKRAFPQGFGIIDVIGAGETIKIGPQEKLSKATPLGDCWGSSWYELPIVGELSNPIILIPSCKIANHRPLVWGPPKLVGRTSAETAHPFWRLDMNWD